MARGKYRLKRERAQERPRLEASKLEKEKQTAAHEETKVKKENGAELERKPIVKNITDVLLVIFTAVLAFVAYRQEVISDRQLKVMRTEEGPLIEITASLPPDLTVGQTVSVPFIMKNVGKSVARNLRFRADVQVLAQKEEAHLDCVLEKDACASSALSAGGLFPNRDMNLLVYRQITKQGEPNVITDREWQDWQNNHAYEVAMGRIDYDDVSGGHHWTQFCVWYANPAHGPGNSYSSRSCTGFNGVDGE
jgi:hypothetical protein